MNKFALTRLAMEEIELEVEKAAEKQKLEESGTSDAVLSEITDPPETEEVTEDTTTDPVEEPTGDTTTEDGSTEGEETTGEETSTDPEDAGEEATPPADNESMGLPETEDQTDAREASVAAESYMKLIDKGIKACATLEQIADIVESSIEAGGLSPNTASITKVAVESIYKELDIATGESISVESFSSASSRTKVSLEAMEDIKKKIEYIWQLIINGFKAVVEFIKKAVVAYRSDMGKQKEELEKLKEIYRNIRKVDPTEPELKGVLYQVLLNNDSQSTKSSEVITLGKNTLAILDSYLISFRKNLSTSLEAIDSISMELVLPNNEFKKENLTAFGKIFGVHQAVQFNKKPTINGFKKSSDTIACYETDLMAGNMKLVSFTATEGNLVAQDILDSKCLLMAVERTNDNTLAMEACEERDFRKLFELIDESIRISSKTYEVADVVEKSISKILLVTSKLSSDFVKQGAAKFDKDPEDSRRKTHIYSQLSAALQAFYTSPLRAVLRYNNRYVKALNAYGLESLKAYQ